MIKGTGVDIVEISRIEEAAGASGRFLKRVFTDAELTYCSGGKRRWASLAARFAAKEAVSKALGSGIGRVRWNDIEIVNREDGKPQVLLHGEASRLAAQMGIAKLEVSLSHSREYAVAFVIAY